MAKRFLCYDTDNPVGVTPEGVLDTNAIGGENINHILGVGFINNDKSNCCIGVSTDGKKTFKRITPTDLIEKYPNCVGYAVVVFPCTKANVGDVINITGGGTRLICYDYSASFYNGSPDIYFEAFTPNIQNEMCRIAVEIAGDDIYYDEKRAELTWTAVQ